MALIICPECGEKISDKSHICIHCGFPISENVGNKAKVDNSIYDISILKKEFDKFSDVNQNRIYQIFKWNYRICCDPSLENKPMPKFEGDKNIYGGDLVQMVGHMFNWWKKNGKMYLTYKFLIECINHNFEYFEFNTADYAAVAPKPVPKPDPNIVRCPKCGSTSVTTQERGYSIMWGVLGSTKKKNLCQKCGYTWWPGAGK